MTTEQPRTTASADHTGRLPAGGLRRGVNRWWYVMFLGTLTFEPMLQVVGAGTGATTGSQAADWLAIIALIAIGVALVVVGELGTDRTKAVVAVIFALLGVATVGFVSTGTVFVVYSAAFAAGSSSPRAARRSFVALSVLLVVLAALSPMEMPFRLGAFAVPVVLVWLIGTSVLTEAENLRESARLRVDNVRIERLATLGERERIARDLHDLLGHTLTGIVVRAQLIRKVAPSDPARAAAEAAHVEQLARDALTEVRAAVSGWRHHALDTEIDIARDVLTAAGVQLRVHTDTTVSMSPAVEAAVALAVREAVTNVVRHADARSCSVEVVTAGDDVRLTVADDGRGTGAPDGSGLSGMRERITALGGHVDRRMDGGTTLIVAVPVRGLAPRPGPAKR
ncbi:sensor histidine kinase [Cellulomonas sp. ATA003]|uniref:sensor histidine kinase n=1 Tax=Cellulomonas sp. ATA003 TaxID=3073064 RepID=UPI002873D948|nr:sensor histidine kinase [Cellulomonas sp. ATA003]WNB84636.1 sensor histidine kinase [Cellulomonas sp. ATA003]